MKLLKTYGPAWLGMSRYIPYPARAAKLSFDINIFSWWWKPSFAHHKNLTEAARAEGGTIWYARWLFVQIRYSRWL